MSDLPPEPEWLYHVPDQDRPIARVGLDQHGMIAVALVCRDDDHPTSEPGMVYRMTTPDDDLLHVTNTVQPSYVPPRTQSVERGRLTSEHAVALAAALERVAATIEGRRFRV